ncbi:NUDIX domain-containing protein [Rhodobacter sp. M37P]|uniref:ADP-ribose pyrophosphatase n=1 Tax=Rhodobacter calidifons TaxID=2715277 RepID=A0ABX0G9P4_9RHOB|nr:NUDIX domain-containing protein [Rhodobacter calidifons]NHB77577.1 NUDIX domain-containing protein [Rhodobacter calidifons]
MVQGAGPAQTAARAEYLRAVLGPGGPPDGAEGLALAALVLRGVGHLPVELAIRRLPGLRVEAASRVRAAAAAGRGLREGAGEVEAGAVEPSHAGFFAVDVHRLRHRRFDGSLSAELVREVFVAGDAVTVLPYDPVRDRVLLIEQFRMGPFGRGDPLPWQLEAIAGRIDPGETPEAAARREAMEEAGLVLGRLEKVAEYYPTPGAVTEYLYSYVALCDLPDGVAGLFGAADEGEDIKGHLISFDRLVEVMASGEIGNAPLLLTVLWLQRERARLRG